MDPIDTDAILIDVKTRGDRGFRVIFDLPETAVVEAAKLLAMNRRYVKLRVEHTEQDESNFP